MIKFEEVVEEVSQVAFDCLKDGSVRKNRLLYFVCDHFSEKYDIEMIRIVLKYLEHEKGYIRTDPPHISDLVYATEVFAATQKIREGQKQESQAKQFIKELCERYPSDALKQETFRIDRNKENNWLISLDFKYALLEDRFWICSNGVDNSWKIYLNGKIKVIKGDLNLDNLDEKTITAICDGINAIDNVKKAYELLNKISMFSITFL